MKKVSKKEMIVSMSVGACLLFGAGNSFAEAVFDFNEGTGFDTAQIGASMISKDGDVTITMKTVDIIGQDGSLTSEGEKHKTNIFKAHATMGINDGNLKGSEYENFDPNEGWVFSFDVDVQLGSIKTSSFGRGAELTISGSDFDDIVLVGGKKKYSLNDTIVHAGTRVTLQMTSGVDADDTTVRLAELTVSAGE